MKALLVTPYFYPAVEWGGPVQSVLLLARGLKAIGVDVSIVTSNGRGNADLAQVECGRAEVDGVTVEYFQSMGPRRYFFSPSALGRLLFSAGGADVIHIQGIWTFFSLAAAAAARAWRVPYILSPRGGLDPWSLEQKHRKKALYEWLVEGKIIERAEFLHFTSEAERRSVPSKFRSVPAVVVPNAVQIGSGRAFGHLEEQGLRLLISGRIHPKKGFDVLVGAIRILKDRGVPVSVRVAGHDEGGYSRHVRELAKSMGVLSAFEFLGGLNRDDLGGELRSCDALVAPSRQENFGLSVAEALLAARPVVVSEGVNIAEDIRQAGAGLVVPLKEAALAEAIEKLYRNPDERRRMGDRGYSFASAEWSVESVAKRMVAAYNAVLKA